MKIVDYLKNFMATLKSKKRNQLLLDLPDNLYSDLISDYQINSIIENMPKNLSEMEKAYYIYLELGKIVSDSPTFTFSNEKGKQKHFYDKVNSDYYGICKSISELYVSILNDERVGVSADLVKKYPNIKLTHVDTILKIAGKNYIVSLINDLSRIKTSRRVNYFCFALDNFNGNPKFYEDNIAYLRRLEKYYGKIDTLSREDIEQLDKRFGYSFFVPQFSNEDSRGLYTDDVVEMLKKDMNNPESFRKYVLHDKDVSEEELLKYKLDYIFENVNNFTDYNSSLNYLESIRYYLYLARKLLPLKECIRIHPYVATIGDDLSHIISILKVSPINISDDQNNNLYYLYSADDKRYVSKTSEEIKDFIDGIGKDSLHIVGTFDKFNPRRTDELEL